MAGKQVIIHPNSSLTRDGSSSSRRPLLRQSQSSISATVSHAGSRFAEVAGGTTAECAAVACCCPCGLADLAVLVVYRVPAGLCKRALRQRRRQRLMKKGLLPLPSSRSSFSSIDDDFSLGDVGRYAAEWKMLRTRSSSDVEDIMSDAAIGLCGGEGGCCGGGGDEVEGAGDFMELEKEMWDHFYGGGFWRNAGDKDKPPQCPTN